MTQKTGGLLARVLAAFPAGPNSYPVRNPATGSVIAQVANVGNAQAVTEAVERAALVHPHNSADRKAMLARWYSLFLLHIDDLAHIATLESGKPLAEAKGEVQYAASYIKYYADLEIAGKTIISPHSLNKTRLWTVKQPVGPCALITPWNFPYAMAVRKISPAIAAGNACILKPAPETPLSAFAMKLLANDAGIPDDAFQILSADRQNAVDVVGKVLMADTRIRKVSFTGSTNAGISLMQQAATTMKKASMELGGNAPLIIFEDADLNQAVDGCMFGKFRNAGQACIAVNRIYIHSKIHNEFVSKLAEKIKILRVGDGLNNKTTVGPLITKTSVDRVAALVSSSLESGAQLVFQSSLSNELQASGGYFYPPTLLTNVTDDMEIFKTEIFGPVAAVSTFDTEEDVVRRANDTPFGLAAYLFTNDIARLHRVAENLEAGMVGLNECAISAAVAPFGGVKMSGIGREGSSEGIEEYLETKYLCLAV
ncbi:hypothetical protein HK100_000710 [Physocladia obscura]|uniref:Succinate-semialdehyde dehydrogenase, mitochondrial n=1 Tax=Physocladia obscura TaxID=109957 RepID=A0AAD5T0S6_9FUNG|nr:hypothetical protein HK100_000710 [Physocladia obscura]